MYQPEIETVLLAYKCLPKKGVLVGSRLLELVYDQGDLTDYIDLSNRPNVKGRSKILSKSSRTSKSVASTISSPPKAAVAASNGKKDELHRRRNPLNEILRRRSGESEDVTGNGSSSTQAVEDPTPPSDAKNGIDDVRGADRIAELEKMRAIIKQEKEENRADLEQARQCSKTDQETIRQLRKELAKRHSKAGAEVPPSTQDNNHLNEISEFRDGKEDDLIRQNYDLRHNITQLREQLNSQDELHQQSLERGESHSDKDWNEIRSRLHTVEKESQERLQQLLSLKSSISHLTRSDSQITDNELVESFSHLAHRIREWVVSNYRRSKLGLGNLPPQVIKILASITPTWKKIENSKRLALYQAIVSCSLMRILEEPFIVGLPDTGPIGSIRQFTQTLHTTTMIEYHEWIRATIRMLEENHMETIQRTKNELLHELAQEIEHVLFTLTSINLPTSAQASLMSLLSFAADLQRKLVLQKAEYRVTFFRNQEGRSIGFDERTMESIDALDDEGDIRKELTFQFCVSPSLQKHGNEEGEHLEVDNIILRARVLCCVVG